MSWKDVTANCGCVIEMDLSHDWESGVTTAEDVSIITPCKTHSPTKHAPDVVESAASSDILHASEVSASEAESNPATTQVM